MNCAELAGRIEELQPDADTTDVARLCLLLSNVEEATQLLEDEDNLTSAWKEMGLKLQSATDQHAAMTEELECLAQTDPKKFSSDQIWVLIRAIKVQSQVLQAHLNQEQVQLNLILHEILLLECYLIFFYIRRH